jgi:hypothetical protein
MYGMHHRQTRQNYYPSLKKPALLRNQIDTKRNQPEIVNGRRGRRDSFPTDSDHRERHRMLALSLG